ncbi:MAG TPA: thiamine-phosphate kinase [Candidatus Limnocylindrales bacterium]|nr:thiamine-phosphate kinase [Candidatus Limnocylindrales bacterium]
MGSDKVGSSPSSKDAELGERKIIDIIVRHLETMPNPPVPFGDDVSAVDLDQKRVAILKTDMLVGKTDMPPNMSLWQASRKAVVMNISDFASKGVEPIAALVSLGLPRGFMQKDIEEIARGLNAGAREYGAYIVGGDTGEASDLIISVSLFGTAEKTSLMLRSGARPGDVLAVTGFFGKPAAGLRLLMDNCSASPHLRDVLLGAVCMPNARLKEGLALSRSGAASASIDSSDGLAWSLHEIARMSNVSFVVNTVPVSDEVKRFAEFNNLDPLELALYGGEEYELVVTVKPNRWAEAETAVEAIGGCLLPIGKATRDTQMLLDVDGQKRPIEARGWEHFKSKI